MECRQVVRSASRGMRTASSLLQQQQRFQSSSPNPNRSTIDDLLSNSPYKPAPARRGPAAPTSSRTSTLFSATRGAGLASLLPPRPDRPGQPSTGRMPNPWAVGSKLAKKIEDDAKKAGVISGVNRSPTTLWTAEDFKKKYDLDEVEDLRLSPSVGRLIHVHGNVDARQAIARVNKVAQRNKLKSMVGAQRSHERPALRRKRKLRDAWRVRFRQGFKAVVHRAMELRKQGW